MDLNKFGPGSHSSLPQRATSQTPYDTLRPPPVIRTVESKLVLEKERLDGGVDQLVHEVPYRSSHPGALFYVTDVPISSSKSDGERAPFHRVLFVAVPKQDSELFVANVATAFKESSPDDFATTFISRFGAEELVTIPRR